MKFDLYVPAETVNKMNKDFGLKKLEGRSYLRIGDCVRLKDSAYLPVNFGRREGQIVRNHMNGLFSVEINGARFLVYSEEVDILAEAEA